MRALVIWCLLAATTGLQAQTVYRCGPEGRVYSQTPCPQGRAVDVDDQRSVEQRSVAQERVRKDQALGQAMERDRLEREAALPVASAILIDGRRSHGPSATEAKPSKKKKAKGKTASPDFTAAAPAKKTKTTKAKA
jgi:hypothetical protein